MQPDKIEMIKYSLEKAEQAIASAKINIEKEFLSDAQNRIYYAAFYSVLALGYLDDFVTSKHSQLMGWFNKIHIHEKKTFPSNLFTIYKNAYKNRMKFDYMVYETPKTEDIFSDLANIELFVSTIKKHILENLNP